MMKIATQSSGRWSGKAMRSGPRGARAIAFALTCFVGSLAPADAAAQVCPDRTIRIVVGVAAGAGVDQSSRQFADGLEKELGVPVIVDNRPGADGIIAVRQVISALPDGYTPLFGVGAQVAINPAIYANLPYDPLRDLAPISLLARQPLFLVVNPSLPVTTLKELVDYSRKHPGTVSYSAGSSTFMLAAESLKRRSGVDMQHIPYNGSGQAMTAVMAGTVQVALIGGQA